MVELNEDDVNVSHCRLAGVPDKWKLLWEILCYMIILFELFLTCALACALLIMTIIMCVSFGRDLVNGGSARHQVMTSCQSMLVRLVAASITLLKADSWRLVHSIGLIDHHLFDNYIDTDADFAQPTLAHDVEKSG